MKAPRGHSLTEALIALGLTAIIGSALAGAFSSAQAVARRHSWTVRSSEALRVSVFTLGDELRFLDPATDLRVVTPDSVALRAFRGTGVVCGVGPGGSTFVRYRGLREPEPAKDSVLVVDSIGNVRPAALRYSERAGDACEGAAGASVYRWSLPLPTPPGTLLLLFESGSYHLTDRALRYRRGDGGRQPLTAELLDDRGSTFAPALGDRGVVPIAIEGIFSLRPDVEAGSGVPARVARFRFALLNVRDTGARP